MDADRVKALSERLGKVIVTSGEPETVIACGEAQDALDALLRQVDELRERGDYWRDLYQKEGHGVLALRAELDAMRGALEWLDMRGGLGLDVHARIRAALEKK